MIPRFYTNDLILLGGADVRTDLFRVAILILNLTGFAISSRTASRHIHFVYCHWHTSRNS